MFYTILADGRKVGVEEFLFDILPNYQDKKNPQSVKANIIKAGMEGRRFNRINDKYYQNPQGRYLLNGQVLFDIEDIKNPQSLLEIKEAFKVNGKYPASVKEALDLFKEKRLLKGEVRI